MKPRIPAIFLLPMLALACISCKIQPSPPAVQSAPRPSASIAAIPAKPSDSARDSDRCDSLLPDWSNWKTQSGRIRHRKKRFDDSPINLSIPCRDVFSWREKERSTRCSPLLRGSLAEGWRPNTMRSGGPCSRRFGPSAETCRSRENSREK